MYFFCHWISNVAKTIGFIEVFVYQNIPTPMVLQRFSCFWGDGPGYPGRGQASVALVTDGPGQRRLGPSDSESKIDPKLDPNKY